MITLVTRGDDGPDQEALLARGVQWQVPMYSCLAGFVEPGESLEGAVVREVREEVGIEVADVTYRGSQPWPFPHSLMIGFRARYVSGELVLDPTEIADAGWYRRDELPTIPPGISIARKLIDAWVADDAR
jgi:NAD+ diphosphatase